MNTFLDWLALHELDVQMAKRVLMARRSGKLFGRPSAHWPLPKASSAEVYPALGSLQKSLSRYVVPALGKHLDIDHGLFDCGDWLEFAPLSEAHGYGRPHTLDRGVGQKPLVRMSWQGQIEDLICLAHEVAHAMQIKLSKHDLMPPLARETCAFIGELLLIEYARSHDADLFQVLVETWQRENSRYLMGDLELLESALYQPSTSYDYRFNYPFARLAAVKLFKQGPGEWLRNLFCAGRAGMSHLPIEDMASDANCAANDLPPLPDANPACPELDAYRSLGAMTLLELCDPQKASDQSIQRYFTDRLGHLCTGTAFLALDDDRKPIAYATWRTSADDEAVTLVRQSAPFDDHEALRQALAQHLAVSAQSISGCNHTVVAQ